MRSMSLVWLLIWSVVVLLISVMTVTHHGVVTSATHNSSLPHWHKATTAKVSDITPLSTDSVSSLLHTQKYELRSEEPPQHTTDDSFNHHGQPDTHVKVETVRNSTHYNISITFLKVNAGIAYEVNEGRSQHCLVEMKSPVGTVLALRITKCRLVPMTIWQFKHQQRYWPPLLKTDFCPELNRSIYSWTHHLVMYFRPVDVLRVKVGLSVKVIKPSEAGSLRVRHLSPSLGYIEPTKVHNQYFSSCVTITPQPHHVIFLTHNSTRFYCLHTALFLGQCGQELHAGRRFRSLPLTFPTWLGAGYLPPGDKYQNSSWTMSLLYSGFVFENVNQKDIRLKLVFSIHPNVPRKVGRGWNCSRSVWADLYLHFPCDLKAQCLGGEDETHCPYYSDTCGLSQFRARGSCFLFLWGLDFEHDLQKSKEVCEKQGASLATFDSTLQWQDVMTTFISTGHNTFSLWIDLHPTLQDVKNINDIYIRNMYVNTWRWGEGTIAYHFHYSFQQDCSQAFIQNFVWKLPSMPAARCTKHPKNKRKNQILCRSPLQGDQKQKERIVLDVNMNLTQSPATLVTCRLRHVTHMALACGDQSLCSVKLKRRGLSGTARCQTSLGQAAPYFKCKSSEEYVPFGVVCDWSVDCSDKSDESFCHFPPCGNHTFPCGNGQCIDIKQVCDDIVNCKSKADENFCELRKRSDRTTLFYVIDPPALVNLDQLGGFSLTALLPNTSQCPDSHFRCPGSGYCLPLYTRCNGVSDCPGHEDEVECHLYSCEGLYRCRGQGRTVCMHVKHVCDGWPQCPQHDDELMCPLTASCPDHCVCFGTRFTDTTVFEAATFPTVRHLEGRGSGVTMVSLRHQTLLIYLGAGQCQWRNLSSVHLPNLHFLDVRDNFLHHINFQNFLALPRLEELDLSGNPLSPRWFQSDTSPKVESLLLLNLSHVSTEFGDLTTLSDLLPRVEVVDFSYSQLKRLDGKEMFGSIKVLDLRGCPITHFSPDAMKGMSRLEHVRADDFKLCCGVVLPDDFVGRCLAPDDEISSCQHLLKSGFYRAALAIFATTALLGNLCSFVYRVWSSSVKRKVGYAVFILHLCVSDFLMGVYLLIIGLADLSYAGEYLWKDTAWKRSITCRVSGFLSFLSCEVSSTVLCLTTLDRFLVLRFPFSRLRFGSRSAHLACVAGWGVGVVLASVPLLPSTSHWAFYSQTSICIPLPVTRADFPGHHYSFSVMILLNMLAFLLLAVGQALIFWSITVTIMPQEDSKSKDSVVHKDRTRSTEALVARRLLVIAMSDFACWFPIGVCGLLSKLDVPVPGEVNTAMAVIVLPLNSALNPFLYTYTIIQEKRRKEKAARLQAFVVAQVRTQLAAIKH